MMWRSCHIRWNTLVQKNCGKSLQSQCQRRKLPTLDKSVGVPVTHSDLPPSSIAHSVGSSPRYPSENPISVLSRIPESDLTSSTRDKGHLSLSPNVTNVVEPLIVHKNLISSNTCVMATFSVCHKDHSVVVHQQILRQIKFQSLVHQPWQNRVIYRLNWVRPLCCWTRPRLISPHHPNLVRSWY